MKDVLGYEGKRVIVSGAASGMGAATTELLVELGAEVHTIDIKKPDLTGLASFTETDLREPDQIDAAVAKIGKVVDALFNCAGLPNTFSNLDVMLVNFCGLRHLTEARGPEHRGGRCDREHRVVGRHRLADEHGGARQPAGHARLRRRQGVVRGRPRSASPTATACRRRRSTRTPRCVRSRWRRSVSVSTASTPGPTDTPMMPHFEEAVGKDFMANFPKPLWGRNARPDEQAWPLLFLNSPRSSYVTGVQFDADAGFKAGIFTGQIDPSALIPEGMR